MQADDDDERRDEIDSVNEGAVDLAVAMGEAGFTSENAELWVTVTSAMPAPWWTRP